MNGFPKGARVCFLGDSITHANHYISRIADYYRSNLSDRGVVFYNCGVSGGSLRTLLAIFDEDIAVHKPTHAVIMIGINDSARYLLNDLPRGKERFDRLLDAFEVYKQRLSEICQKLEGLGCDITLCTQTPYDEYQESDVPTYKGSFALLAAYAEYIRCFAKEKGYSLCDYHPYISKVAQTEDIINSDRVHPNEFGHYHMAKCFLSSQGFDIGEYCPIPEYLSEWRENVEDLRNIRAAEHLIIGDYSLGTESRIVRMKEYLENTPSAEPYFLMLARQYLKNKPIQKHIEDKISDFMENRFYK